LSQKPTNPSEQHSFGSRGPPPKRDFFANQMHPTHMEPSSPALKPATHSKQHSFGSCGQPPRRDFDAISQMHLTHMEPNSPDLKTHKPSKQHSFGSCGRPPRLNSTRTNRTRLKWNLIARVPKPTNPSKQHSFGSCRRPPKPDSDAVQMHPTHVEPNNPGFKTHKSFKVTLFWSV
jgi:hypothetical protein